MWEDSCDRPSCPSTTHLLGCPSSPFVWRGGPEGPGSFVGSDVVSKDGTREVSEGRREEGRARVPAGTEDVPWPILQGKKTVV